jgi:16S rRNA (cytosine967-C5)-methyltransferase
MSLAATGAHVTAVEVSPPRIARLHQNLRRIGVAADVVQADIRNWLPDRLFQVVILDAPCTGTGTIRRHPDILRLKEPQDVARMATLQGALLNKAASFVAPGGLLIYSTCSLEPAEGERQIEAFLHEHPEFVLTPVSPPEIGGMVQCITNRGELRTLPFHMKLDRPELSGIDGFYAARLRRAEA